MVPELRPEAPAPIASRSYSRTLAPASASSAASEQPKMPPPAIATSGAGTRQLLRRVEGPHDPGVHLDPLRRELGERRAQRRLARERRAQHGQGGRLVAGGEGLQA